MKLFYVANMRLPSERAHSIQIVKMCEALANNGLDVELIVPKRTTHINKSIHDYYGVQDSFKISRLWCLDTVRFGRIGFWLESITFAMSLTPYVIKKQGIFYVREEFGAWLLSLLGKQVIWEAHMGQNNLFVKSIIRSVVPIVVISQGLKDLYIKMGVREDRILLAHDAVDLNQFDRAITQTEAREKLGINSPKKLIMYTGSRQSWKGVNTLEEAGKFVSDAKVVVVSGKPHRDMPMYLKSADILVIPNSAREIISRLYTSPMKLFEYMTSGVPIVASDLPSIREVLSEDIAYFFTPDNPESLSKTIEYVLSHYDEAQGKAKRAFEKVQGYSWENRARNIIEFIER